MTRKEELKLRSDELKKLERVFKQCPWLLNHLLEPEVGDHSCLKEAEQYGIRGASCYTAFIEDNYDGTYACRHEGCDAPKAHSLDRAVRHQRADHFGHKPFRCVPLGGATCGRQFYAQADLATHQQHCP